MAGDSEATEDEDEAAAGSWAARSWAEKDATLAGSQAAMGAVQGRARVLRDRIKGRT